MTVLGHIKNGVIVPDEPIVLPEGATVRVEVLPPKEKNSESAPQLSLAEKLLKYAGIADDLPTDLARNHDHYIHGTPKK
jgi:predicted DNA-binding antitoxin AbrB/MazE fold protein